MNFRKTFFTAFWLCFGLISLAIPAWGQQRISIALLDWPPYLGQEMPNQGYVVQVIKEAYKRAGYNDVNIEFLPWARVVRGTKEGKFHAYGPEYFSQDLEKDFIFSEPFPGGPLGFFVLKSKKIKYTGDLNALSKFKVGVVKDFVNTVEFDRASFLTKEEAVDDFTNLKKLLGGRIDLMVSDEFVGQYMLKTRLPESADQVEFLSPPLEDKDFYLCFSRTAPDHRQAVEAFNQGIKEMIADGTMEKIRKNSNL